MSARLVLLSLLAAITVPASHAQGDGILVVRPAPSLTFDAGLGPRLAGDALPVEPPRSAATPRERGAWRGAKRGFLVGVGVGAAATLATFIAADNGDLKCEYFCWSLVAAAATVPFTVLTTGAGAAIGASTARPERVPPPTLEAP